MKVLYKTMSPIADDEKRIETAEHATNEKSSEQTNEYQKIRRSETLEREEQIAKWMENIREFIRSIDVTQL